MQNPDFFDPGSVPIIGFRSMNCRALFLASLGLLTIAPTIAVAAEKVEKPWMFRFRLVNLAPANKSNPFTALSTDFPADAVHVTHKTIPEVDLTYFFTKNIAAELVLTYPQKHNVILAGVGTLGSIDHLPPTLMLQYHFDAPQSNVRPYVGVGINYTRITRANLSVAGTGLAIERSSTGLALQLGCDVKVGENLYINFDYKRLRLQADVSVASSGAYLTTAKLDPNLFSVGVGFRF